MYVIGTQRIDGDARHDGRVDAARQADDDVGEAVLAHVVARAQHQCFVQLGGGGERGRDSGNRRRDIAPERSVRDVDEWHLGLGAPATRVEQPLAVDRLDVHVGDHQFLDELRSASDEPALGIEHHRAAVEHQLVLAAHLVDVDERAAGIRGARRQHPFAVRPLVEVVRRAVDVDVQLGATGSLFGKWPGRAPHVFADADADLHAADHIQLVRVAGVARCEVTGLVEHRVVRQQPLAIGADDFAIGTHRRGVVDVAISSDISDHGGATTGVRGHLGQRFEIVGHESGLQHQIFRRVAGDRQLGERDDVASGGLGRVVGRDDLGHIAVEIADGGIQLGEGDAQAGHAVKATDQPPSK